MTKQILIAVLLGACCASVGLAADGLDKDFAAPPVSARPWVYWFVMDGNFTREGITADFEALKRAGIGGMLIMEVNVGIPQGPVKFMSPEWRQLFQHAVAEAERLGLQITLNAGPGWTGTGGPWVKPEQSMQHVVASAVEVSGPAKFDAALPRPTPRAPYGPSCDSAASAPAPTRGPRLRRALGWSATSSRKDAATIRCATCRR